MKTNFPPLPRAVRKAWADWLFETIRRDEARTKLLRSWSKEKTNKEVFLEKW